ncbi:tetratricopeptide repeat protein [Photobacterium kishitanii]|uniref:tetratricopeptide repeat protein n=1 Tax=Photobacterium kishitanii TaxID=318456 RepID=UPI0007F91565|nr:tetratricopeptide repeat protein [Photobacterium kishitanii]OBU33368.1 hypothetical protein AYY23_14960 [Photobacterium kishitanii]
MSELNRRLSALTPQSHDAAVVLQPATIKPLPKKRWWYGVVAILIAVMLMVALSYWRQQSAAVVAPAPASSPSVAAVATTVVVAAQPQTVASLTDSDRVVLTAMPEAEPAIETLEMEQELASSYEQGYDSGYQQALAEQQVKDIAIEPPQEAKVALVSKPLLSSLSIKTVALTPSQLAEVEYRKAEKVLRQANSRQAIIHLEAALKYRPQWVAARQKLAALYYGRGDNRQAVAMLQQGLQQQPQNTELRLTLAKLLVNEKQLQAALTVLEQPLKVDSIAFLAMRAALAQQLNNTALALTSYQQLLLHDASDGRWWLGLAIAQERSQQQTAALTSYRNGLTHGGLSVASQHFIQQRIMALQTQRI